MKYQFPHITHMDQVLEAIQGRDEFIVKYDREHGYAVVNYQVNFEDTFPPVVDRRTALLRECRGITFDLKTGQVIARKFHKFHNLNEKVETQPENIDFSQPHWILEKLDGSMITPMAVNGAIRFNTKMGLTGIALQIDAYAKGKTQLIEFCKFVLAAGMTPMFEWCSRSQRIVIDHPVDRLVLLAIRENVTGEYMDYDKLVQLGAQYGVEVVRQVPGTADNIERLMEEVRGLEGEEGWIIRFADGHMLKMKAEQYLRLHKSLDGLRFEKDVIRMIIGNQLDDIKGLLPPDLVARVDSFAKEIHSNIKKLASDLFWTAQASYDNFNGGKKRFATEVIPQHERKLAGLLFTAWDYIDSEKTEQDFIEYVTKMVGDHTSSSGRVDEARYLFGGISWHEAKDEE